MMVRLRHPLSFLVRLSHPLSILACWSLGVQSCSNFAMNNDYGISVRTMDLGAVPFQWMIVTRPAGSKGLRSSKHGYTAFVEQVGPALLDTLISAGMNDAGLSCDIQTLLGSKHPGHNESLDNIDSAFICQWALEGFGSVRDLKTALDGVNFVTSMIDGHIGFADAHWVFRDAWDHGLVIEFLEGKMQVYDDNNDEGKTGFGIMTNEPPFLWQLEAVKHLKWKQSLSRTAVTMPGTWYPDERFQRIHLVKSAMPQPKNYEEAVMQAVHTLNTVTVPMGSQLGTDSGKGEGHGDHTQWAVIYDHKNLIIYWRSDANQNLQRLRLADAKLSGGMKEQKLLLESPRLPWFNDAAAAFEPKEKQDSLVPV